MVIVGSSVTSSSSIHSEVCRSEGRVVTKEKVIILKRRQPVYQKNNNRKTYSSARSSFHLSLELSSRWRSTPRVGWIFKSGSSSARGGDLACDKAAQARFCWRAPQGHNGGLHRPLALVISTRTRRHRVSGSKNPRP